MAAEMTNLVTNVTAPVNYVLMRGLLNAARKRLPFFNGTMPGDLEENRGSKSVRWERIENLSTVTTTLDEPTGNAAFFNGRTSVVPTVTRIDVAVAKYGNAITLTEEVDLIQVNARAARFLETLGKNAGESLNESMQSVVLAGVTSTMTRFAGDVASAGLIATAISANDIKDIVNQLNRNSAEKMFAQGTGSTNIGTSPIRSSYFGIVHPDVEEDIRDLSDFIAVEQYAGYTDTFPGEFGAAYGVRWCTTEIANITSDGATASANGLRGTSANAHDVYDTLIYGMEAIGSVGLGEQHAEAIYKMGDRVPAVELINHPPGSSGVADPFNEVGTLSWKAWFAGKVLNGDWVGRLRTAASSL